MPNNAFQLKCGNKLIYHGRPRPVESNPDIAFAPGLGIHENCCRCKCPCQPECKTEAVGDDFNGYPGDPPDSPPWIVDSGTWRKDGNSNLFLDSRPGTGQLHVNIGAVANEFYIQLQGKVDEGPYLPGTKLQVGLYAEGFVGSHGFTLEFYVVSSAATGDIVKFSLVVDLPSGGSASTTVNWDTFPNYNLEVTLRFEDDETEKLTACATSSGVAIIDDKKLIGVGTDHNFTNILSGIRGEVLVTTEHHIYVDQYMFCGPEAFVECPECPTLPSVLYVIPDDTNYPTNSGCDGCYSVWEENIPIAVYNIEGTCQYKRDISDICEWEYSGNYFHCFGRTITTTLIIQVYFSSLGGSDGPFYWGIDITYKPLSDPVNLDCHDWLLQHFEYGTDDFGSGEPICDDFPMTLIPQNNVVPEEHDQCDFNTHPVSFTLADVTAVFALTGKMPDPNYKPRLKRIGPMSAVKGKGTYLYKLLVRVHLINPSTCRCKGDFAWLNTQPDEFWEREDKQKWLEDLIATEAKRRFKTVDYALIRRILKIVKSKSVRE